MENKKIKLSILGVSKVTLSGFLENLGYEKWRADQVWSWIYKKNATSFDEMSNLSAKIKEDLKDNFLFERPKILKREISKDGTEKIALSLIDKEIVEMVFIPEEERGTLCVSSQVGCLVKCAFCFTGTQKFSRNLEIDEIIGQVLLMRDLLNDKGTNNEKRTLTNIVFMGMGEPFHNYSNVSEAIKILMDPDGLCFSKRRITVSTSGVVPFISRCGNELGVNIAISLHATNDNLRNQLMPINKQYPINSLIEACRNYPGLNATRRITFEYIMLQGVNDSEKEAKELVQLIRGIHSKINLIPWNYWPGSKFKASSEPRIKAFAKILTKARFACLIRSPRGVDISAACGQLKSEMISKITN